MGRSFPEIKKKNDNKSRDRKSTAYPREKMDVEYPILL